ncbi:NAD(P)-binding protein [Rhizodiscina lignyota]|uniref:NAD(P)-binding protein n=1 Tax=Rhizodiscina lignyota TaxID=1504668 RepID=A0A9P4M1K9_9PEZI|nr:NAD(P)-binding protein [Rhizodiscina lignyota]
MAANELSLAGKVAIVTGSGRTNGIGAAIALALAKRGAAVTVNYVSESSSSKAAEVEKTIKNAGGKVTVIRADIGVPAQAKDLVTKTLSAFNTDKIDILVNNGAAGPYTNMMDAEASEVMDSTFRTNVVGTLNLVQAVVPHMPKGGRIINISSVITKLAIAMPVYGATKAALDFMTVAWAGELGKTHGITVNSIAPGPTTTDMAPPDDHPLAIHLKSLTLAADRFGAPEEIANAVVLVASPLSSWVTGQFISASGGVTNGL